MNKTIIGMCVVTIFLLMNVTSGVAFSTDNTQDTSFTHNVFIEECTATWCPNCPLAAEALHNIYESGNYSFYYVSHIDDMNPLSKIRNRGFTFGLFRIYAFPTMYFDGGYINKVGRENSLKETEDEYRTLIEQVGRRTTRELSMESSVTWEDDAKISVDLKVTNQGNLPYFGKIRSYVTEIESRWIDNSSKPYHFGFLDYAINEFIFLMPGKSKNLTGSFDGNLGHSGQTYPDITSDNIMVISTAAHWLPHFRTGYKNDWYTQKYFAFYTDQTTATIPI